MVARASIRALLEGNDEILRSTSAAGLPVASVMDTNSRPEQRLCASAGSIADIPALTTDCRLPLQLLPPHAMDSAVAVVAKLSEARPLHSIAPATPPPEEPAIFVLLSMIPRFFSTAVTATKYISCTAVGQVTCQSHKDMHTAATRATNATHQEPAAAEADCLHCSCCGGLMQQAAMLLHR